MKIGPIVAAGLLGAALLSHSASAGDGGQDVTERSLRCFSESHLEVRFSLDPKSELKPPRPTARFIGYRHDEVLFGKGLALTASSVTDDEITASLSSGGKTQVTLSLSMATAAPVVFAGGDCFTVRVEKVTGTMTLARPLTAAGQTVPAAPSPTTCLLETQFESGCE